MTNKQTITPTMQSALEQLQREGTLNGVHGNTVRALVSKGLVSETNGGGYTLSGAAPVQRSTQAELIGNAQRYRFRWIDDAAWRISPTVDARVGDYAFWDRARKGLARGYELAGTFLKPLESKVAAWTLGAMPRLSSDNETVQTFVTDWFRDNHRSIKTAYREAIGLGDCYIVFNGDASLTVVLPHVVERIVDDNDWSRIIGYRITQTYSHPDRLAGTQTIEDEYYANQRVRTIYTNGKPRTQRFPNPLGRIPVVHIRNNAGEDELNGRPEGEALLKVLEWYNEVLIAGLQGNIRQGRPTPVMEGLTADEIEFLWDAMGTQEEYIDQNGKKQTETVIHFDADRLLTIAGSFKYAQPGSFATDTEKLLGLLFYLILQHTEIPEFIWGNAIASSKASAESQMPAFVRFIEDKQSSLSWMVELLALYVAYLSLVEPGVAEDEDVNVTHAPLTDQDGKLTLDAIALGRKEGLLDRETALSLMPLDIDDPVKVLEAIDAEIEAERAAEEARQIAQFERDMGFEDPDDDAMEDDLTTEMRDIQEVAAKYGHINFSPTDAMRTAAQRGLGLRSEFGRGGTAVGIARARDIANGRDMSPSTVRRMLSFFARHEGNKQSDAWSTDPSNPSNSYIAWLLWGGDAGYAWARARAKQMDAADAKESHSGVTLITEQGHTGAMVAFFVDEDVSDTLHQLALDAGIPTPTPVDEMHLTLAYLGDIADLQDVQDLVVRAARQFASTHPAIRGEISGVGRFTNTHMEDMDAVYLSFDSPQLPMFRQNLVRTLMDNGVNVVQNHGFTPHITLGYIPKDAPMPDIRINSMLNLLFRDITVAWGDDVESYELMETEKVA